MHFDDSNNTLEGSGTFTLMPITVQIRQQYNESIVTNYRYEAVYLSINVSQSEQVQLRGPPRRISSKQKNQQLA